MIRIRNLFRGRDSAAESEARAERERSEEALRHAREHVVMPALAVIRRNHISDMIRENLSGGRRGKERSA